MGEDRFYDLRDLYIELREHHVLEVTELSARLNRALVIANGYLTDIEGEDSWAYDYARERANLDALTPPSVAPRIQGVVAAPHDAPRQQPDKDE